MSLMTGAAMTIQRYQLKIYDGQYEVLHKWLFIVDLDLGAAYAPSILNERLVALTRQAEAANEPMGNPRLEVWAGDVKILDWTG